MKRAVLIFVLASLAACRGCAGPEAPTEAVIERLVDPYTRASGVGSMNERASEVLTDIGRQLGYGSVAGDVLTKHANQQWAVRMAILLSHGGTPQLAAAWEDIRVQVGEGFGVPIEIKVRVRQAQSRILDLENTDASDEILRRAYLAEIAWIMVLQEQDRSKSEAP